MRNIIREMSVVVKPLCPVLNWSLVTFGLVVSIPGEDLRFFGDGDCQHEYG